MTNSATIGSTLSGRRQRLTHICSKSVSCSSQLTSPSAGSGATCGAAESYSFRHAPADPAMSAGSASKPGSSLRRSSSSQLRALSQPSDGLAGASSGSSPAPPVRKKRHWPSSREPSPCRILTHIKKEKSSLAFS